jgi:hypothetical protein
LERISLYPLKLDDIVRDVLTIAPPPKKKAKKNSDGAKERAVKVQHSSSEAR